MRIAVKSNCMSLIINLLDHREIIRLLGGNEKGCFRIILIQNIKHTLRICRRTIIKCQINDFLIILRIHGSNCNSRLKRHGLISFCLCCLFCFFRLFFGFFLLLCFFLFLYFYLT